MDLYESCRSTLKEMGLSDTDIDAWIAENVREDAFLAVCICPQCSGRLKRTLDEYQGGASQIVGQWFKYRCVSCPYWIDRKEPVGEN